MASTIAGITSATINGAPFSITKFAWSPNSIKRETLIGLNGVHGPKVMPVAGKIEMTVRDASNFSVSSLQQMDNVIVQGLQANGKSIIGTGMWVVEVQMVESEDATYDLVLEGNDVSEVTV